MTELCFVDANVFVYWRDPADTAKHARAGEWLDQLWSSGTGRTSTQALSEFYTTITRKVAHPIPRHEAWDHVASLLAWRPQAIDTPVLEGARRVEDRYRLHWWDSLIVAAAEAQHCVLLLSEGLQDGAVYGAVTVRDPFRLTVAEAIATYGEAPKPRYRRRPSAMRA
ncbi:MAG: hypothetical protein CMLOHMNK_02677 [Steroidobacteraceae bacterium]|nr:hypothetical protein [Steroidobacteraceae bacterium]